MKAVCSVESANASVPLTLTRGWMRQIQECAQMIDDLPLDVKNHDRWLGLRERLCRVITNHAELERMARWLATAKPANEAAKGFPKKVE